MKLNNKTKYKKYLFFKSWKVDEYYFYDRNNLLVLEWWFQFYEN